MTFKTPVPVDVKFDKEDENMYLYKWYTFNSDRYTFDRFLSKEAWRSKYNTDQDDWYFWVRVNLKFWMVITYAEWDVTIKLTKSDEAMKKELKEMWELYWENPPAFVVYNASL